MVALNLKPMLTVQKTSNDEILQCFTDACEESVSGIDDILILRPYVKKL